MVSRSSEEAMKVHMHTRFCVLCVLTFLFQQCSHCHGDGHYGDGHAHHDRAQDQDRGDPAAPGEAESEQRFYIQQLFQRYGQHDRLEFSGFQNLLLSLGLGEVRVVGLEHEELGHDHVAHLDLLEVQEGLHSHSPSHPHNHEHDREHDHEHQHPHPHPRLESSPVAHDLSPCKSTTASPTVPAGPVVIHDHDPDHDRDHKPDHDRDHKPDHDRDHNLDPDHDRNHNPDHDHGHHHREQDDRGVDHKPHRRHNHRHKLNSTAAQTEQPGEAGQPDQAAQPRQPEQPDAAPPTEQPSPREHKPKRTRAKSKASRSRSRGSPATPPPPSAPRDDGNAREAAEDREGSRNPPSGRQEPPPGGDRDRGKGNVRRRRREAPESPTHSGPAYHHPDLGHQHEECLNLTQLLHYYGLSAHSLISPTTFTYLCPALLYQIDSRVCIRHYHQVDIAPAAPEPAHSAWIWVWGFVSITVISLLSLLGVVLVPILNQSCFKFLLTFLVALAVGTLSGDALLHLLPHSQGQHQHSHDSAHAGHAAGLMEDFDGVWKGLTALAGIYLLFIIEHCIGMFKHYKDQGGGWCRKRRKGEEAKIGRKLSDHKLNRRSDAEWLHLKPLTADGVDSSMLSCEGKHNDTQLSELQEPGSPRGSTAAPGPHGEGGAPHNGRKAKTKRHGHGHSHGHAHQGHCHSDQEMKDAGVASIAWMVIMGDGMHNFSDGLAIGAAFSANVTGGISTSVAVFCHELPHELGDFAVLLKAGMSVKQALVYNVLSALMAYVGMLIGTAVGQYTHNVTSWIFAITAGMFLYVALVDMLPEMLHGDSEDHKRCQLGHFLLQNVGMLTGFGIMLLIAIFEDRIVLDFGF